MSEEPIPSGYIVPQDELAEPISARDWLEACRERARGRVPHDLFEGLHPEVWDFLPWGHKLVVLRLPPEERTAGGIIVPEMARAQNACGWVLTVGVDINVPDPSRYPSVNPHPHPVDLVGTEVTFGIYAGSPLRFSGTDSAYGQEPNKIMVVELTIGDVHGEVLR